MLICNGLYYRKVIEQKKQSSISHENKQFVKHFYFNLKFQISNSFRMFYIYNSTHERTMIQQQFTINSVDENIIIFGDCFASVAT